MVRRGMKPRFMNALTRQDTAWDFTPPTYGRLAGLDLAPRLTGLPALLPAPGPDAPGSLAIARSWPFRRTG